MAATEINGRIILFENEMCRTFGLYASCNCCDRIIFEDEMSAEWYEALTPANKTYIDNLINSKA